MRMHAPIKNIKILLISKVRLIIISFLSLRETDMGAAKSPAVGFVRCDNVNELSHGEQF
jgi:hypothetical protein